MDYKRMQAVASIGAGVAVLHGLSSRRWKAWHTAFVLLGLFATAASLLEDA